MAIQEFKQIDILFNNVGISNVGRLDEVEPEVWDKVMSVNVKRVLSSDKIYSSPYDGTAEQMHH